MSARQTELETVTLFRSWFNDCLTIDRFAEYNCLSNDDAIRIIEHGRNIHNLNAEIVKNGGIDLYPTNKW